MRGSRRLSDAPRGPIAAGPGIPNSVVCPRCRGPRRPVAPRFNELQLCLPIGCLRFRVGTVVFKE